MKTKDDLKIGFNALVWEDLPPVGSPPKYVRYQIQALLTSVDPIMGAVTFSKWINGVEQLPIISGPIHVDESANMQDVYPTANDQINIMIEHFKRAFDETEFKPPVPPAPKPVATYGDGVRALLTNLDLYLQATGEIVIQVDPKAPVDPGNA
jgi:hypothetical protein